jgi:hypothetical protein
MTTTTDNITATVDTPASGSPAAITRRITLRGALLLDAAVTGANGAAYLLLAGPIGDLLGLEPALLRVLGGVLVAFALAVWLTATRPAVPRPAVVAIIAVNAAWAVGSVTLSIAGWWSPTTIGTLWVVAQALVVGAFAELQATALRR